MTRRRTILCGSYASWNYVWTFVLVNLVTDWHELPKYWNSWLVNNPCSLKVSYTSWMTHTSVTTHFAEFYLHPLLCSCYLFDCGSAVVWSYCLVTVLGNTWMVTISLIHVDQLPAECRNQKIRIDTPGCWMNAVSLLAGRCTLVQPIRQFHQCLITDIDIVLSIVTYHWVLLYILVACFFFQHLTFLFLIVIKLLEIERKNGIDVDDCGLIIIMFDE